MDILGVDPLTKKYGDLTAVDRISFSVGQIEKDDELRGYRTHGQPIDKYHHHESQKP